MVLGPSRGVAVGLAALVSVAVALAGCGGETSQAIAPNLMMPSTDPRVEVKVFDVNEREPAPDLKGLTLEGDELALSDLLGQVVIVNTWASWCGPCEDEMPLLLDIEKNYQRDGVSLLGINVEDKPQDAKEFATKFGIDFPSLVDSDSKLLASLPGAPPNALPSTLIIDRNGQIGARIVGPVKPGVIEEILDGWLTS
ncbi:MAG: TlpA family protein disulfide reductase [Actinobacteria bacterium]|nr:TlpA family protein disulfide reductase [Actinomycetota bacterium]